MSLPAHIGFAKETFGEGKIKFHIITAFANGISSLKTFYFKAAFSAIFISFIFIASSFLIYIAVGDETTNVFHFSYTDYFPFPAIKYFVLS